jgi:putative phosphoribosyl transferase
MKERFADRTEAGMLLAGQLQRMRLREPIVVMALPRGGVPVAAEIARALHAPLDLLLVRKIGAPRQPELAVGAVAEGSPPELVIDAEVQRSSGADSRYIEETAQRESQENVRRRELYLRGRVPPEVEGRTVIVVDDGIATGSTMRAALRAIRRQRPATLVLAVPVAAADTLASLREEADRVVCLAQPSPFRAVGLHYDDFHQVEDDEVLDALEALPATDTRSACLGRPETR